MKKTALTLFCLIMALVFLGCAAATRVIDYGHMKTDVAMSESIFLTPTEASKTIYIKTTNTSSNQNISPAFQSIVFSVIQAKGYQVVQRPSEVTYVLQANIRYSGEWRQGMSFENTVTGAGLGALAGLGLGAGPRGRTRGAIIGGGVGSLVGMGLGFATDMATRIRTEILVIEFQITERLSEEEDITGQQIQRSETVTDRRVMGAMGTRMDVPTSKTIRRQTTSSKAGTKIYNAAVVARAAQVNLNVEEATVRLIENAGRQIAGIF
jgi:hypothetical protein